MVVVEMTHLPGRRRAFGMENALIGGQGGILRRLWHRTRQDCRVVPSLSATRDVLLRELLQVEVDASSHHISARTKNTIFA
jgi:hypothetical protein